ncbi:hypothetical protein OROMI_027645 [Orobanche minor]
MLLRQLGQIPKAAHLRKQSRIWLKTMDASGMRRTKEVNKQLAILALFQDAIGAIDGTHIEAVINDENGVPFRNLRGAKS